MRSWAQETFVAQDRQTLHPGNPLGLPGCFRKKCTNFLEALGRRVVVVIPLECEMNISTEHDVNFNPQFGAWNGPTLGLAAKLKSF